MVEIRNATMDDCAYIGSNLSVDDRAELSLRSDLPGWEAVYRSWSGSCRCKVALVDGIPRAMWGVVHVGDGCGELWMLGTDLSSCIREVAQVFETELWSISRGYKYLYNYMWTKQRLYRRLLTRYGFVFDYEDTVDSNGEQLVKFIWRCDNV